MTSTAFEALERDWSVVARSRQANAELRSWGDQALRPFDTPGAVVTFLRGADKQAANAVLLPLARRSRDNHLAARILLEAVIPGLKNVARSYRELDDPEEVASMVVTAALERIRSYPYRQRPNNIAANVVLDTRNRLNQIRHEALAHGLRVDDPVRHLEAARKDVPMNPGEELLGAVTQAVQRGRLSSQRAQLILERRLLDRPVSDSASDLGISVDGVRQARHRGERALAASVDASVGADLW